MDFHRTPQRPDIPSTYTVNDQIYISAEHDAADQEDTAWSLACLDITPNHISVCPQAQTMPSWGASNSTWTDDHILVKSIAFLPLLPHPVTEYATVYSAMKNFVAVGSQLVQTEILMYCDEGVYCVVEEIQMKRPQEFSTLVPVLGTFPMVKTVLRCIG